MIGKIGLNAMECNGPILWHKARNECDLYNTILMWDYISTQLCMIHVILVANFKKVLFTSFYYLCMTNFIVYHKIETLVTVYLMDYS